MTLPPLVEELHVLGVQHRATAAGDDPAVPGGHLRGGLGLPPAEARLPLLLEDLGDGHARFFLDVLVQVDKLPVQESGQPAADAGLAAAHKAAQHNIPLQGAPPSHGKARASSAWASRHSCRMSWGWKAVPYQASWAATA